MPDYKGFARWAVQEGPWQGGHLDGGAVQEAAVRFGVIKEVKYDPAIHGENDCGVEPGDPWFVFTESENSPVT